MIITIDEDICKKYGLSLPEVLAISLVKSGVDISSTFVNLEEKGALVKNVFSQFLVTRAYDEKVCNVLLDSDKDHQPLDKLENIAIKMMEIFPHQKKAGTSQYFQGNKKDIIHRLKKFFKLYGNKFTDEQVITATKNYVESFNGNYTYMRVLKYFIWKDEIKEDSEGNRYVNETSDLATYIENESSSTEKDDWTSTLR